MSRALVVGIGNDLRRDDGVGRVVADAVGRLVAGVDVRLEHQLLPELAEILIGYDRVVFVDAAGQGALDRGGVVVREVGPTARVVRGHVADPGVVLALAAMLGGPMPQAWLVTVRAGDFGHGEGLSPATAALALQALAAVRELCRGEASSGI